ncbi:MAG TPA: MerR family transcriptional regulator [Terriglobales bacterium]|nr:MerR family transcriptional regulator [Terriglobales bacterium]
MQIGEMAQRTSLSADTIRFYEKRRLLPPAGRSSGGFRRYTEKDVERLRFIRQMQALGFRLREIGELIELRGHKVEACESVKGLLQAKLADVRAKRRDLCRLEAQLEMDLRRCSQELKHRRRHAPCPCPVLQEGEKANEN